jgi:hypothetical protein
VKPTPCSVGAMANTTRPRDRGPGRPLGTPPPQYVDRPSGRGTRPVMLDRSLRPIDSRINRTSRGNISFSPAKQCRGVRGGSCCEGSCRPGDRLAVVLQIREAGLGAHCGVWSPGAGTMMGYRRDDGAKAAGLVCHLALRSPCVAIRRVGPRGYRPCGRDTTDVTERNYDIAHG